MGVRIDKLVGPPHFLKIQDMMTLTNRVMLMIPELLSAVYQQDLAACEQMAEAISRSENEVDQIKHGLRQRVYSSLFFSFPKRDFMDFVYQLDGITDRCELLAKTFTYRTISTPESLKVLLNNLTHLLMLMHKHLNAIIIDEVPGLIEASFSGPEAQAVVSMIDAIIQEGQPLKAQVHDVLVALFQAELSVSELLIWQKAVLTLENLGISIEKSATDLRSLMEK